MSYLLGRWGLKLELVGDWHEKNWGVFLHAHTHKDFIYMYLIVKFGDCQILTHESTSPSI